jgi:hypothetical protein
MVECDAMFMVRLKDANKGALFPDRKVRFQSGYDTTEETRIRIYGNS